MSEDYSDLPEIMRMIAEGGGIETALKVARRFGGDHVYIPKLDDLLRRVRDARIREDREAGATVLALARRHDLTVRQVYAILAEEPEALPPGLFDAA